MDSKGINNYPNILVHIMISISYINLSGFVVVWILVVIKLVKSRFTLVLRIEK